MTYECGKAESDYVWKLNWLLCKDLVKKSFICFVFKCCYSMCEQGKCKLLGNIYIF